MRYRTFFKFIIITVFFSCKERYDIPVQSVREDVLVVEGFISTIGTTSFMLSRSAALADTSPILPELSALMVVESESGTTQTLTDRGNGQYTADLTIDPTTRYRLRIFTRNQQEYESEYVAVVQSPDLYNLQSGKC